ncbi:MAG TPA: aminotransferase class V-fold PLP-dependent enzyme [Syntrophobacteraceae bacterium]|nr:aminotransferase class V-fold PLP-dependent enzyme [Syntrophobacteraceae bacterium]
MNTKHVYLDNNSTTRLHPDVLEEMLPYLRETYGNASSIHSDHSLFRKVGPWKTS